MALLAEGLKRPLTVVTAPPGFGKTTLLQQWRLSSEGRETPLAWFSIDTDDDEPIRFLTYFVAALRELHPALGADALELLRSPQNLSPKSILTSLLNDVHDHGERIVMVLDDYHLVTATETHDAVTFLLAHQPENLQLVILTRADPPLPLARLRARGLLCEIRAESLRFTTSETEAFLNDAMGLSLTPTQVAALEARTEGWVAGLQLAALSLQGRENAGEFVDAFTGSHQFVLDYLVEEVLQRQTPGRREFLLRTSVLDRMNGPLCDALTGGHDGTAMLEELAHDHLFTVPMDESGTWFRYHHLFAEFLRHRLRRAGTDQETLRLRAADWCEAEGLFTEALAYAFAAKDYGRAAQILERILDSLWREGAIRGMLDWLARLPEDVLAAHPRLALAFARTEMFFGHFANVKTHLAIARAGYERRPDTLQEVHPGELIAIEALSEVRDGVVDDPPLLTRASEELPPEHPLRGMTFFFLGLAHWMNGSVRAALDAFTKAQAISAEQGDKYAYQIATLYLARALVTAGEWAAARSTCDALLRFDGGAVICSVRASVAALLLETNGLDEAEPLLEEDRRRAALENDAWVMIGSTATLARLRQAQGREDEATALMEEAVALAREHHLPWTWINTPLHVHQIELLLQQHKLAEAQAAFEDASQKGQRGLHLPLLDEADKIVSLRLRIHHAEQAMDRAALEAVTACLSTLQDSTLQAGRGSHHLDVQILSARAHQALGNREEASRALNCALQMADPHGVLRPFLSEGEALIPTLRIASDTGGTPLLGSQLLRILMEDRAPQSIAVAAGASRPATHEGLSAREVEVLRLMAEGLTNKQIAKTLDIALDTAKKHASNILHKLESGNRTHAVARARELDLI